MVKSSAVFLPPSQRNVKLFNYFNHPGPLRYPVRPRFILFPLFLLLSPPPPPLPPLPPPPSPRELVSEERGAVDTAHRREKEPYFLRSGLFLDYLQTHFLQILFFCTRIYTYISITRNKRFLRVPHIHPLVFICFA